MEVQVLVCASGTTRGTTRGTARGTERSIVKSTVKILYKEARKVSVVKYLHLENK